MGDGYEVQCLILKCAKLHLAIKSLWSKIAIIVLICGDPIYQFTSNSEIGET